MSKDSQSLAQKLRADVNAKRVPDEQIVVVFDYCINAHDKPKKKDRRVIHFVAIGNGSQWGVTDTSGGGSYINRVVTHEDFMTLLGGENVVKAQVVTSVEQFAP